MSYDMNGLVLGRSLTSSECVVPIVANNSHHGVMDSIESMSQGAERKATKMEIGGSPCFRAPWLFMITRIRYT